MNVLIAYSTTEGHTRKIAEFIATEMRVMDCDPKVSSVTEKVKPREFDAVIIAASIHAGQYSNEVVDYVTAHADELNRIPCVFLSVGLSVINKDPAARKSLEETTERFLEITRWKPTTVEQVAGALLYTRYGFIKRMLIRSIMKKAGGDTDTSRDYVYTNWDSLKRVVSAFVARVEPVSH